MHTHTDEPERFADESDRASNIELISNEESVKKFLRGIEKAPPEFDGKHCIDCGHEIPEARLATGAFRDIHCQTKHEFRQRNHRSHYE